MTEPREETAPAPSTDANETPLVEAGREADDPGGAHTKGYSADPPGNPAGTHAGADPAYPLTPESRERP